MQVNNYSKNRISMQKNKLLCKKNTNKYIEVCYNMEIIDAKNLDYKAVNEALRNSDDACTIQNCCGHRFLASGMSQKDLTIYGIPGNALGAYLNDAKITVYGNGQDAVGDTMNEGQILIHGNIGDAAGYAMRGGKIYVKGNAGYRAGIHMKEYKMKKPVMIIGGYAGSFLGEYQAGGIIIVLGLSRNQKRIVGNFPCTGMHGGKMFLRDDCHDITFPKQVTARPASREDLEELRGYLSDYCSAFEYHMDDLLSAPFTVITPDSKNPYKQMYVAN